MGYDAVVLGIGGVGSATLRELARRGLRVLGVDRFVPGHDRGSSHGRTRIIRTAYFEHPDYVPLLRRAWTLWDELVEEAGEPLLVRTGLLETGPPDGEVIAGVREAARVHDLGVEDVPAAAVTERFPGLVVPDGAAAVFEQDAGYLRVEDCVRAHTAAAVAAGADLWSDVTVTRWGSSGAGVRLETTVGTVEADRLVVTAGAWAGQLLADLGVPLVVRRKQLHWYPVHDDRYLVGAGCPLFLHELPHGMFYGFPAVDGSGVKVAEHTGGRIVEDPSTVDRSLDVGEQARVDEVVAALLPGVRPLAAQHAVCTYTMSPDGHFVLDVHPGHDRVVLAAGLSGHGYKFAPVLGELLADLTIDGDSVLPHRFLGIDRFARDR